MILLVVALLICLVESLTKGWATLLLLPVSVIALPVEFFLQWFAIKTIKSQPQFRDIAWLKLAQLLTIIVFYVTVVGFGDTDEVLLFGFVTSSVDSAITQASNLLNIATLVALPILTVWLIVRLVAARKNSLLKTT